MQRRVFLSTKNAPQWFPKLTTLIILALLRRRQFLPAILHAKPDQWLLSDTLLLLGPALLHDLHTLGCCLLFVRQRRWGSSRTLAALGVTRIGGSSSSGPTRTSKIRPDAICEEASMQYCIIARV
jgi:hypothetical protein